ncbi:MAG TPA: hypothetical protein VGO80_01530 [Solirubrobacteraceae bacterium]|jgi:hypothetical protein|nr:hypothetical protein [Solirubrobacteraceae bacterium]
MLFDDPSSSSPSDGDTRPAVATRPALRATPVPVEPDRAPQPQGDRTPAGRAHDPRLIESAGAPAPEALHATAVAAAVVRELYESGREVRFAFVPTRNRVTVLLCDMDGAVLSRLTPGRALEIATGEPVPGTRRR